MPQDEQEPKTDRILIVQGDWDRFLTSLDRLIDLHQKTLLRLKELNHRNEALSQELQRAINLPNTAYAKTNEKKPSQETREETGVASSTVMKEEKSHQQHPNPTAPKTGFLQSLKNRQRPKNSALTQPIPQPPQISKQYANSALCRNCGYPIYRATRYCQRCGIQFGKLICPCGRELSPADRFCDHCGRTVSLS
jgi:hypothetical protein